MTRQELGNTNGGHTEVRRERARSRPTGALEFQTFWHWRLSKMGNACAAPRAPGAKAEGTVEDALGTWAGSAELRLDEVRRRHVV